MNFIEAVKNEYPDKEVFTRPELSLVAEKYSLRKEFTAFMTTESNKIRRGLYKINGSSFMNEVDAIVGKIDTTVVNFSAAAATKKIQKSTLIPDSDPEFVSFGDYNLFKKIVKSRTFLPIYISGESGNGKTKMVYQACAETGTELIRANITESTDEDDLVGGFRLVNGETVWQDGPAVEAMKRGSILLLDEINLGSPKIMCLQPILEGNPIYIKKTNTVVRPLPGFNIIATANTKGKTSEDGRYIGSNTLNEALLDRFGINIEHEYPDEVSELVILKNILESLNCLNDETNAFAINLVAWAKGIRDTFAAGGTDDIITTRRLIHIVRFHAVVGGSRIHAIKYCTSRFDEDTKKSFYSLYKKIDEFAENNVESRSNDSNTQSSTSSSSNIVPSDLTIDSINSVLRNSGLVDN